MRSKFRGPFLSIFILLFVTSAAQAQYFGRNKVQYKDFKFEVLETDHVLGHELVHAFQYDIAAQRANGQTGGGGGGVENLPLWLIEGMAEYLSLGPVDAHTAMWLRDAARKEKLPAISDLDNPKYF